MGFEPVLVNDCWKYVFSFLRYKDLIKVSEVCSVWKKIASSEDLWMALYVKKYPSDKKIIHGNWKQLFYDRNKNDHLPCPMIQLGPWFMIGLPNGDISVYHRSRWKTHRLNGTLKGHKERITSLVICGFDLVSSSKDKTIRIWDFTRKNCLSILEGHQASINILIVTSINKINYLFSGSDDGSVKYWNCKMFCQRCEGTLSQDSSPVTCLLSIYLRPVIISGYQDGKIRITEALKGLSTTHQGHAGSVTCLKRILFSDDFLSGSSDGSIFLWSSLSKSCLRIFNAHSHSIKNIIVTGANQFFSSSSDRTVIIWDKFKPQVIYQSQNTVNIVNFLPNRIFPIIAGYEGNTIFLLIYTKHAVDQKYQWLKVPLITLHKKFDK